jgi:hypothetical protein
MSNLNIFDWNSKQSFVDDMFQNMKKRNIVQKTITSLIMTSNLSLQLQH